MASPPMNNVTDSLARFLPRVHPEHGAAEEEEAAERAWLAHMRHGHETYIRPPAEPPVYAHPHGKGMPLKSTKLWQGKSK